MRRRRKGVVEQGKIIGSQLNRAALPVCQDVPDARAAWNGNDMLVMEREGKQHLQGRNAMVRRNLPHGLVLDKPLAESSRLCQGTVCHEGNAIPVHPGQ